MTVSLVNHRTVLEASFHLYRRAGGWVGGWVNGKRKENKAVGMRCSGLLGGGWVGR